MMDDLKQQLQHHKALAAYHSRQAAKLNKQIKQQSRLNKTIQF